MNYREVLELYKKGELEKEKKEEVEQEVEKHRAIEEYLLEEDARLETLLLAGGDAIREESPQPQEEELITKRVQETIRRAFLKAGILTCAAAVVIFLFVLFGLPRAVDQFFYDPGEKIGEDTNRMSLDLAVYTELFLPAYMRDSVEVEERGYGVYDIVIPQTIAFGKGDFHHAAGKIERNKMKLYDPSVVQEPIGNAFGWLITDGKETDSLRNLQKKGKQIHTVNEGNLSQVREEAELLPDGQLFRIYATLDKRMPYEEFIAHREKLGSLTELWCAVATADKDQEGTLLEYQDAVGFQCSLTSSTDLEWDHKAYPALRTWPTGEDSEACEKNMQKESYMKTHFISLLSYLAEQKAFLETMEGENGDWEWKAQWMRQTAEKIEEEGLLIHGFCGLADKETIQKLTKNNNLFDILIQYD